MMRRVWFHIHWALGLTAGVVLAVIGVTGALLSFEHELLRWMNPGVMTVLSNGAAPVPMPELVSRVQALFPDQRLTSMQLSADPHDAVRASFTPDIRSQDRQGGATGPTRGRRNESRYIDPYTGVILGTPRGQEIFRFISELHRWLAAGDVGKAVTGASTLALLVLSLSGLYLRWPRRIRHWRIWFTFRTARTGRGFLWHLHAIVGTWVLPCYLLAALTGLFWSYEWYRNNLFLCTGTLPPNRDGAVLDAPLTAPANLTAVWASVVQEIGLFRSGQVYLPQKPHQALEVRYLDVEPPHERAFNHLVLHPVSGAVLRHDRYTERPLGAKLIHSMFALHSGRFFGVPGTILMMLASLIMPLFAITGWQLYCDRRGKRQRAPVTT